MSRVILLLALLLLGDAGNKTGVPEVRGRIETRVRFQGESAAAVADASVALLSSCHHRDHDDGDALPGWDRTFRDAEPKSHVYIRFPRPRDVSVLDRTVHVSEMFVVLPFNTGSVWVRIGDGAERFAKYEHEKVLELERTLRNAEPID